jgi:hypothetical protein
MLGGSGYGGRAWASLALALLVVGTSARSAWALEHGPTARVGVEVASARFPVTYAGRAQAPGAAVLLDAERRERSVDGGVRLEMGWTMVRRGRVGYFPHLVAGYTPVGQAERDLATEVDTYTIRARTNWWVVGVGGEFQFFDRAVIVAQEIGAVHRYTWGGFTGTPLRGHLRDTDDELWLRLGVGVRAIRGSKIAAGVRMAGEAGLPGWIWGPVSTRVLLGVFLELDGTRW